jgi:PAS domain S-box-containing protein
MSTEIRVEIFKRIVEQTTDAIIFADREGLIRIWNQGAESVFGFSSGEVLGESLDVIIQEELRKKHWEAIFFTISATRRWVDETHTITC